MYCIYITIFFSSLPQLKNIIRPPQISFKTQVCQNLSDISAQSSVAPPKKRRRGMLAELQPNSIDERCAALTNTNAHYQKLQEKTPDQMRGAGERAFMRRRRSEKEFHEQNFSFYSYGEEALNAVFSPSWHVNNF